MRNKTVLLILMLSLTLAAGAKRYIPLVKSVPTGAGGGGSHGGEAEHAQLAAFFQRQEGIVILQKDCALGYDLTGIGELGGLQVFLALVFTEKIAGLGTRLRAADRAEEVRQDAVPLGCDKIGDQADDQEQRKHAGMQGKIGLFAVGLFFPHGCPRCSGLPSFH